MKGKKLIKWTVLLLMVAVIAIYCSVWPGRQISDNASVQSGNWDSEESKRIVTILRRPHIPTVPAMCDCAPDLCGSLLSDGVEYRLAIRSHDHQGQLWRGDERIAVFYIPSWEMKTIQQVLP